MKIATSSWNPNPQKISRFVTESMGDAGGIIETVQAATQNNTDALGRLVEKLAEKGALTASEVHYIARGYEDSDAFFVVP